jgi:hypothetical protein
VQSGRFAYRSLAGEFVQIVPVGGKDKIAEALRVRLARRSYEPIDHLVINLDSDLPAGVAELSDLPGRIDRVLAKADPARTRDSEGDWLLDAGRTVVSLVRWQADDGPVRGLPEKQTLERLMCAAIAGAYPDRAPVVQDWLDSRPNPPPADAKEHAWSYMAGWHAHGGSEFFCRTIWQDAHVAAELRARLVKSGAWRIAELLTR